MNTLFFHLVAFFSSGLLVLPAGWCDGLLRGDAPFEVPAASCAHCSSQQGSSAPSPAELDCCCELDAVLRDDRIESLQSTGAALLPSPHHADLDAAGPVRGVALYAPVPSGRSLNILHCVWRC